MSEGPDVVPVTRWRPDCPPDRIGPSARPDRPAPCRTAGPAAGYGTWARPACPGCRPATRLPMVSAGRDAVARVCGTAAEEDLRRLVIYIVKALRWRVIETGDHPPHIADVLDGDDPQPPARPRVAAALRPDVRVGRILAACGGVFVAGSLGRRVFVDGVRSGRWGVLGVPVRGSGHRSVSCSGPGRFGGAGRSPRAWPREVWGRGVMRRASRGAARPIPWRSASSATCRVIRSW